MLSIECEGMEEEDSGEVAVDARGCKQLVEVRVRGEGVRVEVDKTR